MFIVKGRGIFGASGIRHYSSLLSSKKHPLRFESVSVCQNCVVKRNLSTFETAYLKIVSLPAVHHLEDTLASVHDMTGLPWWCSIIVSTSLFRLLLTLPAHVTQQKVMGQHNLYCFLIGQYYLYCLLIGQYFLYCLLIGQYCLYCLP